MLRKEIKEFAESTDTGINWLNKTKRVSLLLEAFIILMCIVDPQ